MLFTVSMNTLSVDGTDTPREVGSDSFTEAIQHYLSAIEHGKGEVRWGATAREVRITFLSMGRITERTIIRFALGGELEVKVFGH